MSVVDEVYCACGKKWNEANPNCVFNYHSIAKSDDDTNVFVETCNNLGIHAIED